MRMVGTMRTSGGSLGHALRFALAAIGLVAGCGRIHQHSENWVLVDDGAPKDPRVRLGIVGTHTDDDAGTFRDREIRDAAPYTVHVIATGDPVDTPLVVHAMQLSPGNAVTDGHGSAALEPSGEGQPWLARVEIALGDRLTWQEGEVVALEVSATLPWDPSPATIRRDFRAVLETSSGAKIDAIVGQ